MKKIEEALLVVIAVSGLAMVGCGAVEAGGETGQGPSQGAGEELGVTQSEILDGTLVSPGTYPAVGVVWAGTSTPNIYNTGTGTLIGSRYVITAAHVVSSQWGVYPPNVYVELDNGGGKVRYYAESIYLHPSYLQSLKDPILNKMWTNYTKDGVFDAAILILSQVPAGITPMSLSTAEPTPSTAVSFLGYGQYATGGATPVQNARDLYRGTNTVSTYNQTYVDMVYTPGTSGTYHGDSGGPLLIGSNVAGVNWGGGGYTYGSSVIYTRTGTIQPWIAGFMPGGAGMFAPDVYEGTEQTRPAFALNTLGHYSEPRSLTDSTDVDKISFQLTSSSHVRISCPHHFDWTTPQPSVTLTKDGASVSLSNPNTALYEADLAAGTYVATVKNNYSRGLSYTLGISSDGWFVQGDPFEPDQLGGSMHLIGVDAFPRPHNIMPANDEDYVALQVSAAQNVRIETLPLSGNPDGDRSADTVVTLLDSSMNVLAVNDDRPNSYCSLIETPLAAGIYYIKVAGYLGNQVGYYDLKVSSF